MNSMLTFVALLEKLQTTGLNIQPMRCVRVRNRNASCRACVDACVSGCIQIEGNEIAIDASACIGCGTCATVCPTAAILPSEPDDQLLIKECVEACKAADGQLVFVCKELADQARALLRQGLFVELPCLGRLDESVLTALAASGIDPIRLCHADCETCRYSAGRSVVNDVQKELATLFDTWNRPLPVRLSNKLPAVLRAEESATLAGDRRRALTEMFTEAKGVTKTAAVTAVEQALPASNNKPEPDKQNTTLHDTMHVTSQGNIETHIPQRKQRLLNALRHMGKPNNELIPTRLWGHVMVDVDACDSCRMCAAFCPTGALAKHDDDTGAIGLRFHPWKCTQCDTCAAICPHEAIEVTREVFATDLLSGLPEYIKLNPVDRPSNPAHSMMHAIGNCSDTYVFER